MRILMEDSRALLRQPKCRWECLTWKSFKEIESLLSLLSSQPTWDYHSQRRWWGSWQRTPGHWWDSPSAVENVLHGKALKKLNHYYPVMPQEPDKISWTFRVMTSVSEKILCSSDFRRVSGWDGRIFRYPEFQKFLEMWHRWLSLLSSQPTWDYHSQRRWWGSWRRTPGHCWDSPSALWSVGPARRWPSDQWRAWNGSSARRAWSVWWSETAGTHCNNKGSCSETLKQAKKETKRTQKREEKNYSPLRWIPVTYIQHSLLMPLLSFFLKTAGLQSGQRSKWQWLRSCAWQLTWR